ncbi:DinB family protein [Peribacillus cavernae]|uniref:DinB family protein n=1 Tax=Peribacillus cavernae TaxID=1674310 RepID=A0A3S0VL24_9BACI|nr:DinB family protein [Peribacillus cavernae]MDQ0217626.1 putative damage-inducible protein DinB [Peribacillus cavernae]RUQ29945.1 DinB family protein [Peribacillus cavernae]
MSELLFKQFELTRNNLLDEVSALNPAIFDIQPEGFNNTIHWHIGHVLTMAEQLVFGFPKESNNLPENYVGLFGYGTKPSDWQGEVPAVEQLVEQLKEQAVRLQQIDADRLQVELKEPFLGLTTFGEIANMTVFHEAYHLGQIHAMNRFISKKN